jgi:chemotaxis protein MotB
VSEAAPPPPPRRKRARPEPDEPPGAPEWVVTFTDMISLLVTFFVLLMTFSSMEEDEVLRIRGLVSGNRGLHDPMRSHRAVEPPPDDLFANTDPLDTHSDPHTRPDEQLEKESNTGEAAEEGQVALDLNVIGDGLLVGFALDCAFAPGSVELSPALERALRELGETLHHYPHQVVVEGHCDDAHRPTERFPDAVALSVARALAAAEPLLSRGVEPERLQVAGYGNERPLTVGGTVEGRQRNRRVEVRILTLSRARADQLRQRVTERLERGGD